MRTHAASFFRATHQVVDCLSLACVLARCLHFSICACLPLAHYTRICSGPPVLLLLLSVVLLLLMSVLLLPLHCKSRARDGGRGGGHGTQLQSHVCNKLTFGTRVDMGALPPIAPLSDSSTALLGNNLRALRGRPSPRAPLGRALGRARRRIPGLWY